MVITRDVFVKLLNMDLELEYTAAIQYINHAAFMYKMAQYDSIRIDVLRDAVEEIEHAIVLADHIYRLGGVPSVSVAPRYIGRDVQKLLCHDRDEEADSIRRYVIRIEQAQQLREYGLARHLNQILLMEHDHLLDFADNDVRRPRERQYTVLEVLDDDEFTRKWAERAMHVPLRLPKSE